MPRPRLRIVRPALAKALTGIQGLDEVTGGGLPKTATQYTDPACSENSQSILIGNIPDPH
jgi:hypothetical protein